MPMNAPAWDAMRMTRNNQSRRGTQSTRTSALPCCATLLSVGFFHGDEPTVNCDGELTLATKSSCVGRGGSRTAR